MAVFSGNGSNGSPSFTFSSDTNTGMYRVGADSIGFSTGSAVSAGYDTTLYLTDRRVLIGTSSTTSDYRFIAQARFGNTGTGAGQILVASGNSNVTNGASIGVLDFGTSTHAALARFDARGNNTGASPQPVSLRWFNHDGSSFNHNLTLSHNRYLRLEAGTGGIQFNGDTAAANALDDYEEGTWTPKLTVDNSVAGITYNSRTGEYTKIGNVVYVSGELDVASYTLVNTGQLEIASLPFTAGSPTGKNYQFFQLTISGIDLSRGFPPDLSPFNVVWGRLITSDLISPTASSIGVYVSPPSGATDITPRFLSGAYLTGHTPIIQFSGWYTI